MELTKIIGAIIFSGLVIVVLLSVYFIRQNRSQRIKIIKRATTGPNYNPSAQKEILPEQSIKKSIEERISGRFKIIKLVAESFNGNTMNEPVAVKFPDINNDLSRQAHSYPARKRFYRLEKVI